MGPTKTTHDLLLIVQYSCYVTLYFIVFEHRSFTTGFIISCWLTLNALSYAHHTSVISNSSNQLVVMVICYQQRRYTLQITTILALLRCDNYSHFAQTVKMWCSKWCTSLQVTMVLSSPTVQASTAGIVTHRLRSSYQCYHDPLPGLDDVCNATDTHTHTFAVDFLERVVLHRLAVFATSSVSVT